MFAPNSYVLDQVSEHHLESIERAIRSLSGYESARVSLAVGSPPVAADMAESTVTRLERARRPVESARMQHNVNPAFTFESFVTGKSNQLARAASEQVADNPGRAYNPLFLYGGVGLGKTHLMHAIGNSLMRADPSAKVVYLHS